MAADSNHSLRELLRVEPGASVRLGELDPAATFGMEKPAAEALTDVQLDRLSDLQDRLWAQARDAVLVVLQGIDTAGKDGTIRKVMGAFNPQGCPVSSFKVPTPQELARDFLWRIHLRVPGKGEIGIFNRSHYEDVLVVRVHELVPRDIWHARYEQIRQFEEMLTGTGTRVVKFFLHIDREEQRKRLQERYDDERKHWKFSMGDLAERARWDDYVAAYEDALAETSTADAPWYVIPSNRKWARNLAVASILADTIDELKPNYPVGEELPPNLVIS